MTFEANSGGTLPAVQGVGNPEYVHGAQVHGRAYKNGRLSHSHRLIDSKGEPIKISPRTPVKGAVKEEFKDYDNVGWIQSYPRVDDIRDSMPEVWLLTPDNLERSLYYWQTGPLQKLAKLLSQKFLEEKWSFEYEGKQHAMPKALQAKHEFFQACVADFPFWKDDLRPKLEHALGNYLGRSARLGLKPDVLAFEAWLQQQLAVSFSAESTGPLIPLRQMGAGWQALVRLAALEVLASFDDLTPMPVVLLYEEPEVFLHPHLRRKLRSVLATLSKKRWLILAATHAPEFVSFREHQQIIRLWRDDAGTNRGQLLTASVAEATRFQEKLDERGNHEAVLANKVVLCEGKGDVFALKTYFEKVGVDLDAHGVTLLDVGGCENEPDFARICQGLGIPWCGLTDEDMQTDGTVKRKTEDTRKELAALKSDRDIVPTWKGSLEECFGLAPPQKAIPEWQEKHVATKSVETLKDDFSEFMKVGDEIRTWIEPGQ